MIAFRTIRGLANRLNRRFTAITPPLNLPHFRPPPPKRSPFRQFLKFGAVVILAPVGAIGCVNFAYTTDEIRGLCNKYTLTKDDKYSSSIFLRIMDLASTSILVYWGARHVFRDMLKENQQCTSIKLLPDVNELHPHPDQLYTLVFYLTGTLVHYDWKKIPLDRKPFKRPGLEAFLEQVLELGYECVLYTDEISASEFLFHEYMVNYFHTSLTRGSTIKQDGKYYRDLSRLNRNPSKILYVSAHALENCLQPENCVPIKPWKNNDMEDTTLSDLLQFLRRVAHERPDDIRPVLLAFNSGGKDVLTEFKNLQRRRMLEGKETKKSNLLKMKESLCQKW